MAFRPCCPSFSFKPSPFTLVSNSALLLVLLFSSTSDIPATPAGQETLHSARNTRGFFRLAEARDLPDETLFGRLGLQRGLLGLKSESHDGKQVTAGAGETGVVESLAEVTGVRETRVRERDLLGIRPGSQGGQQQQQKPEKCVASTLPGYTAMIALADYAGLYFHFNVKGSTLKAAVEARTGADGASKGWFAIGFSKTGKMAGSDVVLGNYVPSTNKKLPVGKPGTGGPQPRPIAYLSVNGTKSGNGTKSAGTGKKGSGAGSGSTNSTKSGNSGNSGNPGSGNVGKGGKHKGALVGAFNMQSLTMGTYAMADNFRIANASVTASKNGTVVRFMRSGPGGSVPVKYGGLNTLIWSYSSTGATKVFGGHMRHRGSAVVNLACKV